MLSWLNWKVTYKTMNHIQKLIQELCPDGVEWKKLGEVCEIKRWESMTKKNVIEGNIPVISGWRGPAYFHSKHNRLGKTITIAGSGAYAGFVMYWEIPIFVNDAFSLQSEWNINMKYVYHLLKKDQNLIHSMKQGSGVPHVYPKDVWNIKIPLPPLEIQREIVKILDSFNTLVNNLTDWLPAEIAARRQQYEYYREKLLTFPEKQ